MKVILRGDIEKVGKLGEVIEVRAGYARNFLIPQQKAFPLTPDASKQIEAEQRRLRILLSLFSMAFLSTKGLSSSSCLWAKYRLPEFQGLWENICMDWSLRFGAKVSGWWVDGAYAPEHRYPEDEPPNLRTYARALKAGNPDAIVAFNQGVKAPVVPMSRN